jgi:branched-chain amino acid aminotransferase
MPLLLDHEGFVTETSTANLLVVRNGVVRSPRPERILQGISLEITIELCTELGIPFEFADLQPEDCVNSSEAFLASSPYGIAPVCQLNDHLYGLHRPIFERLLTGWSQRTGLDIRQQMLEQSGAAAS